MHKLTIMLNDKVGVTVDLSDKDLALWVADPYGFVERFIQPCMIQISNELKEHS